VRKLTLSVDEATIREARRLAKREGTSISSMFSRLVHAMAGLKRARDEVSPTVRRLSGMITLPRGKSDRQALEEALQERYGLDR
jgi:hypothetical protein